MFRPFPPPPPRPSASLASASSSASSSAEPPAAPLSLSAEALGDVDALDVERETTWLQPFQRSWEAIEEDEKGLLLSSSLQLQRARKAQIPVDPPLIVSKGVIRALVLVLDFSSSMALTDLKPSRRLLTLALLSAFIAEFFDQNPLSQLSCVLGHRGVAVKVTELSGHPQEQLRRLREKCETILLEEEKAQRTAGGSAAAAAHGGGSFSLQNTAEMARSTLAGVPSYASREALFIVSSLSTVDASDIQSTIAALKAQRCVCSVIHLAAELHICSALASSTGGRHSVVLHKDHYSTLLRSFLPPTPSTAASAPSAAATRRWMRMGFPTQTTTPFPQLCSCHSILTYTSFRCPHCTSRYCELPTQCTVCSLQLVSSPQLARTYHHLFPSPRYDVREEEELQPPSGDGAVAGRGAGSVVSVCAGCLSELVLGEDLALSCVECAALFCIDCDEFVHGVLHHCPGCHAIVRGKAEDDTAGAARAVGGDGRAAAASSTKANVVARSQAPTADGPVTVKDEPVIMID